MFNHSYFAPRYFAPRYFPERGNNSPPSPTLGIMVGDCAVVFKPATRTFVVRAWMHDLNKKTLDITMNVARCRCFIKDEAGVELFRLIGQADPAGAQYVRFEISVAQLAVGHAYIMELTMGDIAYSNAAWGLFPLPTVP